jgi:hypothetical protein
MDESIEQRGRNAGISSVLYHVILSPRQLPGGGGDGDTRKMVAREKVRHCRAPRRFAGLEGQILPPKFVEAMTCEAQSP